MQPLARVTTQVVGRLKLSGPLAEEIPAFLTSSKTELMPIRLEHALRVARVEGSTVAVSQDPAVDKP